MDIYGTIVREAYHVACGLAIIAGVLFVFVLGIMLGIILQ